MTNQTKNPVLQIDRLSAEVVDAGRRGRVAAEHLALDLLAVDAETPQHRVVRVDDGVERGFGVPERERAAGEIVVLDVDDEQGGGHALPWKGWVATS